jgi:hypothetical protein
MTDCGHACCSITGNAYHAHHDAPPTCPHCARVYYYNEGIMPAGRSLPCVGPGTIATNSRVRLDPRITGRPASVPTGRDRRAPGRFVIRRRGDGRWHVSVDGTTSLVVPTRDDALACVPLGWPVAIIESPPTNRWPAAPWP